jgi:hypothetical protein
MLTFLKNCLDSQFLLSLLIIIDFDYLFTISDSSEERSSSYESASSDRSAENHQKDDYRSCEYGYSGNNRFHSEQRSSSPSPSDYVLRTASLRIEDMHHQYDSKQEKSSNYSTKYQIKKSYQIDSPERSQSRSPSPRVDDRKESHSSSYQDNDHRFKRSIIKPIESPKSTYLTPELEGVKNTS